jgi:16S rRNA (guanine1207-N2)-methyltransferase
MARKRGAHEGDKGAHRGDKGVSGRDRHAPWRDSAAASLMAKALAGIELAGDVLVMLERGEDVAEAVRASGGEPRPWRRMAGGSAGGGLPASSWPPAGPFASAILRLPKSKDELDMAVHAAAAGLESGGRLWVYGANDEGAGSAEGRIREIMAPATTVASGGRCRVLEARRPEEMPGLLGTLDRWGHRFPIDVPQLPATWISFPGVFSHGRIDAGTRALMDVIPSLEPGVQVLDFGCGSGLLGGYIRARQPDVSVDFLDADAVALEAVQANLPGHRRILSDGLPKSGDRRYDLIVSNPPYHEGKGETVRVIEELAQGAPSHLTATGSLLLVTQRRLPVGIHLQAAFARVEIVTDEGPHRVWRASP